MIDGLKKKLTGVI